MGASVGLMGGGTSGDCMSVSLGCMSASLDCMRASVCCMGLV